MTTKPFEFEKSLKELEEITAWFESADVDLDAGLDKFERGMELATKLKDHLATVENRVEKIRQRFSAKSTPASESVPPDTDPYPSADNLPPADESQTGLFGA